MLRTETTLDQSQNPTVRSKLLLLLLLLSLSCLANADVVINSVTTRNTKQQHNLNKQRLVAVCLLLKMVVQRHTIKPARLFLVALLLLLSLLLVVVVVAKQSSAAQRRQEPREVSSASEAFRSEVGAKCRSESLNKQQSTINEYNKQQLCQSTSNNNNNQQTTIKNQQL